MSWAERRQLCQASMHVVEGHSLVVPLIIEGLPADIEVLGGRWRRKREFHLTAMAARVIEGLGQPDGPIWDTIVEVASGRKLGPVEATAEIRRVTHPEASELQTLIVMARCPGLEQLYSDLSGALGAALRVPPAHVTLYSSDPAQGIGIVDEEELADRAPPLSEADQEAVRQAMQISEAGN